MSIIISQFAHRHYAKTNCMAQRSNGLHVAMARAMNRSGRTFYHSSYRWRKKTKETKIIKAIFTLPSIVSCAISHSFLFTLQVYFDWRFKCNCTIDFEFLFGRIHVGQFFNVSCEFSETSWMAPNI